MMHVWMGVCDCDAGGNINDFGFVLCLEGMAHWIKVSRVIEVVMIRN